MGFRLLVEQDPSVTEVCSNGVVLCGDRPRPGRQGGPDVTSHALLRLDVEKLAPVAWNAVALDEAQAIKNPDSQVARAAYRLKARWRMALTGTPVENRLDELWSQLHFLNPGLFGNRSDFEDRYAKPIAEGAPGAAAKLREAAR